MMHDDRLYAFFVTDDRSRWRAFRLSFVIALLVGLLFILCGTKEETAGLLAASSSVVAMTVFTFLYVRRNAPIRVKSDRSRRWLLSKLLLVGAADWMTDLIVGNLPWALSFAATAEAAARSDNQIPIFKASLAKQTIAASLRKAASRYDKALVVAYCQIASAQIYEQAKSGAKVFLRSESLNSLEVPKHAIILRGDEGYAEFRMGTAGVHLRLGHQFMIFEKIVFDGPPPPLRAELITVRHPSKVLVKDCIIKNYHQNLDGITWFDVTFEACEITTTLENTLLLNVTFKNCSIDAPKLNAFPLQASENTSASGITYSSEAQLLSTQAT